MDLPEYLNLLRVPFGQRYIHLVLFRGEQNLLVDSGMSYSFEPHLLTGLAGLGLSPTQLDWLVNLHAHGDHIGGNALLLEASGGRLRIACHREDAPYIREPVRVVRELYGMPEDHPRFQSSVDSCGAPAPVHLELVDGVVFNLGQGVSVEALAAPGHSPGNIALYDRASKTLVQGESIQGLPQQLDDGRLTAPFGLTPHTYRKTLERLLTLPIDTLVSSHEESMGGDQARALIRGCIQGVDAFVSAVQRAAQEGATDPEALYLAVSQRYRLYSPRQLAELC